MLCERNKTCGREGSASASPGPRPWFYRCVNRICVAFTHVPGDLERKTHHLFFFGPLCFQPRLLLVPPASRRVPGWGPEQGAQCPPGAGMAASRCLAPASRRRQHPGLRLSSPALHRREAAFAGHSGGPGGDTDPQAPRDPPSFRDSPSPRSARE